MLDRSGFPDQQGFHGGGLFRGVDAGLLWAVLCPLCQGAIMLLLLWLILWWMYRRRLFLKV